jgi:hypothetical protein
MCWFDKMTLSNSTALAPVASADAAASIPMSTSTSAPMSASTLVPMSVPTDIAKKMDDMLALQQQILQLLQAAPEPSGGDGTIKKELKRELREFMLKHFNIKALDDKTEGEMYDTAVDVLCDLLSKYVPFL